MSLILVVHPDDVNLADVKALAAEHNASVIENRFTPRGQAFIMDGDVLRQPWGAP